jgi:hypothetical protein
MNNLKIEYLKAGGGKCVECNNGVRINRRIRIQGIMPNIKIILCPQHYKEFCVENDIKLAEFITLYGMFW